MKSQHGPASTPGVQGQAADPGTGHRDTWVAAMPWVFVLVWSTGFVVARFGMPWSPPLTFLCWRYFFSLLAFGLWIALSGARWPVGRAQWAHLAVCGAAMHAGYLGGVWAAVKAGIPAGTVALIVGLQPVLTAAWLSWQGSHRIAARQWLGLALGVAGLALVVWQKMNAGEVTASNFSLAIVALLAITYGTLHQKRYVKPVDVRTANFVQLAAALIVSLPLALLEPEAMVINTQLVAAMAWSVLALTLGGSSLLVAMIQRGAATQVTSLMYLVPPCTALLAWLLFAEKISLTMAVGMAICALAVGLVRREIGR
jgi:drug/metabolite transporter (DMT)-like permease